MAQLEILQCSGCGSPLSPGALVCEYCGNKNIIQSKRNPLKINSNIAQKYIAFYAQKTADNPKDTNALYAMGLLYLNLKNYELSQRNFKDAIDQSPLDADMYYYYALSLVAGKRPKHLHAKEISRIEQYINTAIGMETKCKYLVLLASIKQEYYISNRLIVPDPSPRELFEQAQDFTPDDLDEITDHMITLNQAVTYNIDLLLGREQEQNEDEDEDEDEDDKDEINDNQLSEQEIEEATNLTEDQRKQYYDYRFEPTKPTYNCESNNPSLLLRKPAFPILGRTWKLALSLLLSFVMMLACLMWSWGFTTTVNSTSTPLSAEQIVTNSVQQGKKLTKKERAQMIENIDAERVEKAKQDNLTKAQGISIFSKNDTQTEEIHTIYIRKTLGGVLWPILILLPLIIWLLTTTIKVGQTVSQRRAVDAHNQQAKELYQLGMELWQTKPSDAQIRAYTMDFLSIVVGTELGFHQIDEGNLKGKTLFLNEYFTYKEDGANYDDSAVEYKVVLLEEDCVTVISSDWRIYENISDTGTCESISYADITTVKLSEDELCFANMTIEIPDENIFEYQSNDPSNSLTFSNDIISDVREFKIALEKLVRAYKNSRNL